MIILAQQDLLSELDFSSFDFTIPLIIGGIIAVVYLFIMIFSWWRIFEKSQQPGWAIFIPIFNVLVLLRIVRKPWWYLLLFLIPPFTFLLPLVIGIDLAAAFDRSTEFGVCLLMFSLIFVPILGFGGSQYMYMDHSREALPEITQEVQYLPAIE